MKKYGDEYVKAVSVMIARGDFSRNYHGKEGIMIKDLDAYLEYVDLNRYIEINSVELGMLLGKVKSTSLVKYYADPNAVSNIKITGLDLLLYSAVEERVIFDKLLNCEDCDFSKVSYVLNEVIQKNHLQKSELLINKGASLNSIYAGSKITIAEFQLIGILTSLVFSKKINTKDVLDRLQFILKYKEKLELTYYSLLEDILKKNVDFIKQFYVEDLEINSENVLSKIDEFAEILASLRDSGRYI